jgi:FlaA1/EpsC-like NDP-sugar epimerase
LNANKRHIIPSKHNFASKWLVFSVDVFLAVFAFFILAIVDSFKQDPVELWVLLLTIVIGYSFGQFPSKLYTIIVRKTAISDIYKCFLTSLYGFLITSILLIAIHAWSNNTINLPKVLLALVFHSIIVSSLFVLWRLLVRNVFLVKYDNESGPFYWIYGASTAGLLTFDALNPHGTLIGFIDDNKSIQRKYINGLRVYSFSDAVLQIEKSKKPVQVIIAIQNISKAAKATLVEACLNKNLKVKVVPAIETWIHGELTVGQIKPVKIEDLLGRDVINIENKEVSNEIYNRTILITGAAGSIGSELVTQILHYNPSKIFLFDQAETPLFDLEQVIKSYDTNLEIEFVVGDITKLTEIRAVFKNNKIDLVFHAAAYKHVPMMEQNPSTAIKCNLLGTKNLADIADEFKVKKLVFISTDKAVNPTNVMGATKRAAEIYIQSKNAVSETAFITTRFGNVLGSNGSVIPQFKKQIDAGGPVRVTHPEITRYFMTIPEACQLVLEAGAMGEGGEIFIFDMGESVKIIDLAKKMITLSGLEVGKDIEIEFSGLRPGEKLFEELLNDAETTLPTHHNKIMRSKTREYDFEKVFKEIEFFQKIMIDEIDEMELVSSLKKLVPEYLSKNSRFEVLDKDLKLP